MGDFMKQPRGGTRPGAGRPLLDQSKRRVTITIRVRPDVAQWLRDHQGYSVGHAVDALFDAYQSGPLQFSENPLIRK